jgi:hypothetical protein
MPISSADYFRYRPDPATGWEESWMAVFGETVDRCA